MLTKGDSGELKPTESVPQDSEELGEDDPPRKRSAADLARRHRRALRAAAMLAQITERAFLEHQLAACHFHFLNFCEQPRPPICCAAGAYTIPPRSLANRRYNRAHCRGVLRPLEPYDRGHIRSVVHGW